MTFSKKEKNRDFSGFPSDMKRDAEERDRKVQEAIKSGNKVILDGQGNTPLIEPLCEYDQLEAEIVLPKRRGLWGRHRIVFGRDRKERDQFSGYGGRGATSAGSIDIVVGSGGNKPKHKQKVGPNFTTDAARIYLSQRTNVDEYLGLDVGDFSTNGLSSSENRSGIAIKADAVRVVGREGVRIYTTPRTPTNPNIVNSDDTIVEYNSKGEKLQSVGPDRGIHLIAYGDVGTTNVLNPVVPAREGAPTILKVKRLQPIVKGDNLVLFLNEIVAQLGELTTIVQNFTNSQMEFNNYLATHTHEVVGAIPAVATPSIPVVISNVQEMIDQINNHVTLASQKKTDLSQIKGHFLEPQGALSIRSRNNKSN